VADVTRTVAPVGELVDQVLRDVRSRRPIDDAERASIARVELELGRLADPFDQRAGPVHVTGSAVVVGPRGVVLLHHKRLAMWLQPGGHVDPGETPWDAARRETIEETGLAVRFHDDEPRLVHVDVHPAGAHTHLDLRYLLVAPDDEPSPPPGESQDVRWFGWDDAIGIAADPPLAALLRHLRPAHEG
jgi:8-oxo-dGTP pyrophosphatase MutT (NUDIX family)